MTHSKSIKFLAGAAAAAALVPAVADAKLGGHPTLTKIDSNHASLRFAADRLPSPSSAKITFAGGQSVGALKAVGKHGSDVVYRAKVTSKNAFRVGTKYTVTIKVPGAPAEKLLVKAR